MDLCLSALGENTFYKNRQELGHQESRLHATLLLSINVLWKMHVCRISALQVPQRVGQVLYIYGERECGSHSLSPLAEASFSLWPGWNGNCTRVHPSAHKHKAKSNWTLKSQEACSERHRGGRLERRSFTAHVHWRKLEQMMMREFAEIKSFVTPFRSFNHPAGFIWCERTHTRTHQQLLLAGSCKIVKKLWIFCWWSGRDVNWQKTRVSLSLVQHPWDDLCVCVHGL